MDISISQQNDIVNNDSRRVHDDLLLSAAKSGNSSAFIKRCEPRVKKILLRLHLVTKSREDAENSLQDSLLKAFVHLKNFEVRAKFSSWLTSIAINSALMTSRKRPGLKVPIDHFLDEAHTCVVWELRNPTDSPKNHYARREREDMLRDAIRRLPSTLLEASELLHIREYSTSEIVQVLGISVAVAKSRLMRARMVVRASFSERCASRRAYILRPFDRGDVTYPEGSNAASNEGTDYLLDSLGFSKAEARWIITSVA
jgi:RNA polymerase sigma-70 factor, ECF subfamily